MSHPKLSEAAVPGLPSISAPELDSRVAGDPEYVGLVVHLFDDVTTADKALKVLDDAVWAGLIDIYNAAVITKDRDGHVRISQRRDRNVRLSAMFGMQGGAP